MSVVSLSSCGQWSQRIHNNPKGMKSYVHKSIASYIVCLHILLYLLFGKGWVELFAVRGKGLEVYLSLTQNTEKDQPDTESLIMLREGDLLRYAVSNKPNP